MSREKANFCSHSPKMGTPPNERNIFDLDNNTQSICQSIKKPKKNKLIQIRLQLWFKSQRTYGYGEQISCVGYHRREYTDTRSSQSGPGVHNLSAERPWVKEEKLLFYYSIT